MLHIWLKKSEYVVRLLVAIFHVLYFSCPCGELRSLFCLQLCSACPLQNVLPCQHFPNAQSLWCPSHSYTSICLKLLSSHLSCCCLPSSLAQPISWWQLSLCLAVVCFWPLLCQSVANYLFSLPAPWVGNPSCPPLVFIFLLFFVCYSILSVFPLIFSSYLPFILFSSEDHKVMNGLKTKALWH